MNVTTLPGLKMIKPPPRLTIIRHLGEPTDEHTSLDALARRIQQLRKGRGLQVKPCVASYGGSETFEGVTVWLTAKPDADDGYWVGTVVLPHADLPALQAAIRDAGSQRKAA